jgi:hypothetical protein
MPISMSGWVRGWRVPPFIVAVWAPFGTFRRGGRYVPISSARSVAVGWWRGRPVGVTPARTNSMWRG